MLFSMSESPRPARQSARAKLIAAAHTLVRHQGYTGTTVDAVCAQAEVSKGAFFHHFESKEALGVAAAQAWTTRADQLIFTEAAWTQLEDPLARVLAHIDFRIHMMRGAPETFTCFVGTVAQEMALGSPSLQEATAASLAAYCERLAQDIAAAIARHQPRTPIDALNLAYHVQAVMQGAFILAKAEGGAERARNCVWELKRYIRMLFGEENA
jgi:TetR/AcrR family transcriptional regulator, transcriptional repressor for nem operon